MAPVHARNQTTAMLATAKIDQGRKELLVNVVGESSLSGFYICEDAIDHDEYLVFRQNLTMIPDNNVPARFAYRNFERVAQHIGAALRAYPQVINVRSSLASSTLARLVQEAITAKTRYGWKHADIDEALWTAYAESLGTSIHDAHSILIGRRDVLRKGITSVANINETIPECELLAADQLEHLVPIIAVKGFKNAPRFFVRNIPPEKVTEIESQHDVVFTPDESDPTKQYIT